MDSNNITTNNGWEDAFVRWDDKTFMPYVLFITPSEDDAEEFESVFYDGQKVFVYQDLVDYSDKICVIYDETTDEMVAFYIDEESEKDLVPQTKHQDSHYDLDKKY
jgi:hypothetical protein